MVCTQFLSLLMAKVPVTMGNDFMQNCLIVKVAFSWLALACFLTNSGHRNGVQSHISIGFCHGVCAEVCCCEIQFVYISDYQTPFLSYC